MNRSNKGASRAGPRLLASLGGWLVVFGMLGCGGTNRSFQDVQILLPMDASEWEVGQTILFKGQASASSGAVPAEAFAWSSDRDGAIGTGREFSKTNLTEGSHRISLVVNIQGKQLSDSVTIQVRPAGQNKPPVTEILAPFENSQFEEKTPVEFRGQATDPEEGKLPGSALSWTSDRDGLLGNGTNLAVTRLTRGVHLITLVAVDGRGATGRDTVLVEIIPIGQNRKPQTIIHKPEPNATFSTQDDIVFQGEATDPEDGVLTGGALTWASDRDGSLGNGGELNHKLSLGLHQITLKATDSKGAQGVAVVTITVNPPGNQAPKPTISAPEDGSSVEAESPVRFEGTAVDPEDGPLGDSALAWNSSLSGDLGTGKTFSKSDLPVGLQTIQLLARDSGGALGVANISLRVLPKSENKPPQARISSPADNSHFKRGIPIEFIGSGTDPEDGNLVGNALSWSSSRDGALGNGLSLSLASLSEGQHTITLTAIDSKAAIGQARITLVIEPNIPENFPPTARLAGPSEVMTKSPITLDGSASTDSDGSIVRYVFAFGDGTPNQDGSQATAVHTYLAEGSTETSLTVFDNKNASATAKLSLKVTPFVRSEQVVESSRDSLGSPCALTFDASNRAIVAYRNNTHPAVRLARQQADGKFQIETVEGFGLDIGGDSGQHVDVEMDASGRIHLAYLMIQDASTTWLRYVRWDPSNGWSQPLGITLARGKGQTARALALAWNANQGEVQILYQHESPDSVWFARCKADCHLQMNWLIAEAFKETRGTSSRQAWVGDFVSRADGSGGALFSSTYYSSETYQSVVFRSWNLTDGWKPTEAVQGPVTGSTSAIRASLAFDPAGDPLALVAAGILHRQGAEWKLSRIEASPLSTFDLTFDAIADQAFLVHRHGTNLEIVGENQKSYWLYRDLGSMDNATPEIALDQTREVRVCFARDGKVMLF